MLNWHGLGSNGPEQAAFTGYEALAASEGFIVVHPTGVPSPDTDANSWELVDGQDLARDDIAFANALIDTLIDEWCADPSRIYSTGMSNGGYFTARLVCEVADRIAAASSVAGTFHPDGCSPARPVPYLAFHGTEDLVVPFDGSGESRTRLRKRSRAAGVLQPGHAGRVRRVRRRCRLPAPTEEVHGGDRRAPARVRQL